MLLFLIVVVLLISSIILFILSWRSRSMSHMVEEFLSGVIIVLTFIFVIMLIIISSVQVSSRIDAQKLEVDKEVVEIQLKRINQGETQDYLLKGDFGSLEDVYRDGRRINKQIITSRHWRDNIWVGWFYNSHYGDVELIDFAISD